MNNALLEVWSLRLELESLEDYLLVDEVSFICDTDGVDGIIGNFIRTGKLAETEREQLIWYYVLFYSEEYLDE